MATQLTDKQKKRIIADYIEQQNYSAVANKYGVARNTVKKLVLANQGIAEKCQQKREENTLNMLEYMDSRRGTAQDIIDKFLECLTDPVKLEKATLAQIATAIGILVDKFTMTAEKDEERETLAEILEAVKEIKK
nr:MAG TPA: Protein of unknown function (DUF1804) [Caudoviricetes sp.]